MPLHQLTIKQLQEKLKKKEISVEEIVKDIYRRINAAEKNIHAYLTLLDEKIVIEQAKKIDLLISQDGYDADKFPLLGIPLALKDLLCTENLKTTCASKMLENFIPSYDATVVKKLKDAGAIFLGKLNMDEFAMGSSTENSAYGPTKNPWNLETIPGGSSGGSAAAVGADLCIASLGSDTGGSIRQPASCCGIVGLKPTYGRISRFGLIAFASSLDQIGPMTKNVTDTALLLKILAGKDPLDSTSADLAVPDYTKLLNKDLSGLKLGIPKEYFISGIDPEVKQSIEQAIVSLEKLGATRKEISLPHTDYAISTYYVIACAEASSNLARYDGVKFGFRAGGENNLKEMYKHTREQGFGPEVKRRIMLGTYVLSSGYYDAYYLKAQKVRTLIKQDFEEAFKECDVIITPTAPTPAFKIGEKTSDPLQMYLSDIFTISANLAGIPAISLPCGLTKSKLPIGLQIMGRHFYEETVLRTAFAF